MCEWSQTAGKGSYGVAYLATTKDGSQWVLKEISLHGLTKRETDTAMQEARVRFFPQKHY